MLHASRPWFGRRAAGAKYGGGALLGLPSKDHFPDFPIPAPRKKFVKFGPGGEGWGRRGCGEGGVMGVYGVGGVEGVDGVGEDRLGY